MAAVMMIMMASCGFAGENTSVPDTQTREAGTEGSAEERTEISTEIASEAVSTEIPSSEVPDTSSSERADDPEKTVEKSGDIVILYTSDVHCGIDQGFGYAGGGAVL